MSSLPSIFFRLTCPEHPFRSRSTLQCCFKLHVSVPSCTSISRFFVTSPSTVSLHNRCSRLYLLLSTIVQFTVNPTALYTLLAIVSFILVPDGPLRVSEDVYKKHLRPHSSPTYNFCHPCFFFLFSLLPTSPSLLLSSLVPPNLYSHVTCKYAPFISYIDNST